MYYHSRRLQRAEIRYPHIEKVTYVVIQASHYLKAYFLAHKINVLATYLLRNILHMPNIYNR